MKTVEELIKTLSQQITDPVWLKSAETDFVTIKTAFLSKNMNEDEASEKAFATVVQMYQGFYGVCNALRRHWYNATCMMSLTENKFIIRAPLSDILNQQTQGFTMQWKANSNTGTEFRYVVVDENGDEVNDTKMYAIFYVNIYPEKTTQDLESQ